MPIFQVTPTELKPISETTFGAEGIMERKDIQRMLREQISVLDDRLMVIAEEFGDWLDSSRRIDLLCIDSEANLMVIELKRTEENGMGHVLKYLLLFAAALTLGTACADDSLHKAAHRGEVETVKRLLARQPLDVDERDSYGGTALHAAMFQNKMQIVELLLESKFDVNAVGPRNGYTPLHDAVWADNPAAAELLLKHGARTDIKGKDGLTPFMKARQEKRTALLQVFKHHNVDK